MQQHNYVSSPEKVEKSKKLVRAARIKLLQVHPFYASLALNLEIQIAPIGTMAVNDKALFLDPEFICGADPEFLDVQQEHSKILVKNGVMSQKEFDEQKDKLDKFYAPKTREEMQFFILHEIRHLVNGHLDRTKHHKMGHQLANVAQDYNINNRIAYEIYGGISQAKAKLPILEALYTDDRYFSTDGGKYIEWTSEAIYKDLLKKGDGSGGGAGGMSFDVHSDLTQEQKDKIKKDIIRAGKGAGAGKGVPDDIQSMIENWEKPKVKWHRFLDRTIKNTNIHDFDYSNPHSRSWGMTNTLRQGGMLNNRQFCITPSYIKEQTIECLLAFDTSGSISDDVKRKILGETAGIMKQFPACKVRILCWGSKIGNYQEFDNSSLKDIKEYNLVDCGGTQPEIITPFMEENKINVPIVINFTDGEFWGGCGEKPPFNAKVLWVVFGKKDFKPDFGTVIHYEDD